MCFARVLLAARVGFFVFLLQFGKGRMRIDFGGVEAFVAEEFLDGFEVRSVVEHYSGKGVAKHVGAPLALRGDEREVVAHGALHLTAVIRR